MTGSPGATDLERRARSSHRKSASIVWILALAVPAILVALGAPVRLISLGAASWVLGVLVKVPLAVVVAIILRSRSPKLRAVAQGTTSAAAELGMAALVLSRAAQASGLGDIVAFACGAGSLEALVLLVVAAIKQTPQSDLERWSRNAADSAVTRHAFAIERSLAWLGHLGSRSLFTIGWSQVVVLPMTIAFATFATTDGVAGYLGERGADWLDPATLSHYFRLVSWLVLLELVAFAAVVVFLGP